MSGSLLQDLNCLNSEYILHSGYDSYEGRIFIPVTEDFGKDFIRCLAKSPMFNRLWQGGPGELHLRLRIQISEDKDGRLLYNEKPYNKDTWCCYFWGDCQMYGPPKIIRQQGRPAKELADAANTHPEIIIITKNGEEMRLDACPCGGDLIKDDDGSLYCKKCGEVY